MSSLHNQTFGEQITANYINWHYLECGFTVRKGQEQICTELCVILELNANSPLVLSRELSFIYSMCYIFVCWGVSVLVGLGGCSMCVHTYVEARIHIQAYILRCCSLCNLELAKQKGLAGQQAWEMCLCSPRDRITGVCHHTQDFTWVLWTKFRSFILLWKVYAN